MSQLNLKRSQQNVVQRFIKSDPDYEKSDQENRNKNNLFFPKLNRNRTLQSDLQTTHLTSLRMGLWIQTAMMEMTMKARLWFVDLRDDFQHNNQT
jgi:hypothetical protein